MLVAHNTRDWPFERVLRYGPEITAAMNKLREEFPKDVSIPKLAEDIFSGKRQLWVVLDDEKDDAFVSFALTEIKTFDHTGHKMIWLTDLAGSGGTANCPLAKDVENWAREVDAEEVVITGRIGWRRALAKEGYEAKTVVYRKILEAA